MDNNIKGLYNPAILGIFVNGEYDELHHSFLHEFTHHINYISSTFGIHVIIELLEAIENMIIDLGGEILSPFIFRKKKLFYGNFQEHFIEHVKMFNGQITSARITRKNELEKYIKHNKIIFNDNLDGLWNMLIDGNPEDNNIGLSMLDSYGVYHYLRWNYFEKTYFITELGVNCLLECNAYLISQISIGKEKEFIEFEQNRYLYNGDSYMHLYTAPFELLFNTCKESVQRLEDNENLIKILSLMVDICLQMPISNRDRGKKPYPFTPSIWFMVMVEEFEKLKYIPSVQGNERQWYSYLVRALNTRLPSEYKGNTPFSVAINAQRIINEDLNFFTIYVSSLIGDNIDKVCSKEVMKYKKDLILDENRDIEEELKNYLYKNAGCLLEHSFGFGICRLLEKCLGLRKNNFLLFPFMQFVDEHSPQLVPPVFYQNMKPINNLKKIEDVYLLKDMIFLRHLIAILYQINFENKDSYICGNKYFGIYCPFNVNGNCIQEYSGKLKRRATYRKCEFSEMLRYFGLI